MAGDGSRGSNTYLADAGTAGARFVRSTVTQADAYGIADEAEIECLRPNMQIMCGSDDRADYVTIKIAELELAEGGTLVLSNNYIPPCVQVGASRVLIDRLARLVNAVTAKRNSLGELYRGRRQRDR